jgi:uncharacterized protein YndB with AHSA1/START domain
MTVTNVQKDADKLTMTITSEFDATADRVWQMWEDPRLLEKWWGPPTYPATFVDHDFKPGGVVTYYMTGPEGDQPHARWQMVRIEEPNLIELEDSFADENGETNPNMPTMKMRVDIEPDVDSTGTTRMSITTTFPSADAMEQMITMGMEEGMSLALGQIDDLL